MSMRYPGGVISATPPTITPPVDGEGGSASGTWTLQTQLQNSAIWPKPTLPRELYSWGFNSSGELGLGNAISRSSPVQIGGLTTWSQSAAGRYFSVAIKTDGTMWSWGINNYCQLGLNDRFNNRSSPVQIGALTAWYQVAAGNRHGVAIKTDGTMWSWGDGSNGKLGLNDTVIRSSPVQIGALATWTQVAAGSNFNVAIKTNGTMWSWGNGTGGQLGLNDNVDQSSPVQIGALTTWAQVATGTNHSLAIKTDGTVWSWGSSGGTGVLGLNDTDSRSSPVQIGALTTWAQVAGGDSHSLAVKTDGTMWSWGSNFQGQLGLDNDISRSSPVQVGALTTWSKIAAGYGSSFAIKTDGTMWSWGRNGNGQLGLNNTTYSSSPVQVGALTTWSQLAKMPRAKHSLAITKG